MAFKRSIGLLGFSFCIVGATIGSGWLLGPFFVAQLAGPAGVLSWLLGGFIMGTILISYAELSTLLPITGGPIRYLQFTHGSFASFTIAWITWLATVATAPVETLAMIRYAANYLPNLMYKSADLYLLTSWGYVVAAILLFLMVVINGWGAHFLSKSNNYLVFFKLVVISLTLLILFSVNFHWSNFSVGGFAPAGWKGVVMALPSGGVIFSLLGCHAALQLSGEVINPKRNIPLAMLIALLLCTLVYMIIQFAFVGALQPVSFSHGWNKLSYPGDLGPFVGLAMVLGAVWLTKILYLDAAISPFGCGLVYTGASARLGYAMVENGYFPRKLMRLNRFGVPSRLMILNYCVGLLLFFPFHAWQSMMSFLVSALILGYGVGPITLNILRKAINDKKEVFRVPASHFVCFAGFYFSNLLMLWVGWDIMSKMMMAIILGYGVLILYKWRTPGHLFSLHIKNAWWLFPYLASLSLISYLSSFGGIKLLSFGWDLLMVACLSLVIYILSQKLKLKPEETRSLVNMKLQ